MEIFLILILVIIIIVVIARSAGNNSSSAVMTETMSRMVQELRELKKEIKSLRADIEESKLQQPATYHRQQEEVLPPQPAAASPDIYKDEQPTAAQPTEPIAPLPDAIPEDKPTEQPLVPEERPAEEIYSLHDPVLHILPMPELAEETQPIAAYSQPQPGNKYNPTYEPTESWMDKWVRNNPDLEKFIGENLINKIGIAVLVLGIAFFVKYAIDKDWINEAGRVGIGIGCGALLVGLAHYLRLGYRSFSSVLAGGGIAIFYFTIAFAFHQYHLLSQTASFVIMVVITAFAVALAVLYDKLELAVIAAVGGFLAPFLVSTGDGNYIVLFTYLIILNIGLLSLAWFKRWPLLNIIALFFTEAIYGGWLSITLDSNKPVSYPLALAFSTAFYFIFLGMNMINQVRNKQQFKAFDFLILLFISCIHFAFGMCILRLWNNGAYEGLFTLGMGMINLGLTYYVYKSGKADRNLLFLLIGLTLTFLTLTIPIQLHGHAITLFWSAEFVLLYWLAGYSGIRLFRYSSVLICGLTLISLFMDWNKAGMATTGHLAVIYTNLQGIVTNIVAIAAFAGYYVLIRRNTEEEYYLPDISNSFASKLMLTIAIALLFFTCIFGVNFYFNELLTYDLPNVYHRLIAGIFALALLMWAQRNTERASPWLLLPQLIIYFVFYVMSAGYAANFRNGFLQGHYSPAHLAIHFADSILFAVLLWKTIQAIKKQPQVSADLERVLTVVISVITVAFLSIELLHIFVIAAYKKGNIDEMTWQYGKAGLTVIWALCSFAMMWLGMKHRLKVLRIVSLTLFSIVLLKLFIIDISGISEGGKILAFILLGVLLLTVSFMYQKLKKIIIDDKKE